MSRILPVTYKWNYKTELQKVIRGHHIQKDVKDVLVRKAHTGEEAIKCDKNATGVFNSGDKKKLVGHLPIAAFENQLGTIVTEKRKREDGLVVPANYVVLTQNKTFANTLLKKLREKKKKASKLWI